jgi:hypothetical protein
MFFIGKQSKNYQFIFKYRLWIHSFEDLIEHINVNNLGIMNEKYKIPLLDFVEMVISNQGKEKHAITTLIDKDGYEFSCEEFF